MPVAGLCVGLRIPHVGGYTLRVDPKAFRERALGAAHAGQIQFWGDAVFGAGACAIVPGDIVCALETMQACEERNNGRWLLVGCKNLDGMALTLEVTLSGSGLVVWMLKEG